MCKVIWTCAVDLTSSLSINPFHVQGASPTQIPFGSNNAIRLNFNDFQKHRLCFPVPRIVSWQNVVDPETEVDQQHIPISLK